MVEFRVFNSLRAKGLYWVLGSTVVSIGAMWIWMQSQAAWQAHLNNAHSSGVALYETLRFGTPPPTGVGVDPVESAQKANGEAQSLPLISKAPSPAFVTAISFNTDPTQPLTGTRLQLHIVSSDLRYPVAKLQSGSNRRPAAQLGDVARLLASYCSNPLVFARLDQRKWQRVDGLGVWGCEAAPSDNRILAGVLLLLGLILFLSQVTETSTQFRWFAAALKQRSRLGGADVFDERGPEELREITATLNEYLALERDRLEKRALVMSGVSHDLGTPATRLRLRTALIEDTELRSKLEADIDQMTGMIESVLTYTQSEVNSEDPRRISLTSLVQSIVADYADIGKPVLYHEHQTIDFGKSRSVFASGGRNFSLPHDDARRVLVAARPVSLRRAITNLVDNSLKYGRRANVSVEADSETASIIVEDEGSGTSAELMNSLIAPFQRGANANFVEGVGLGLTIVSTIALQHGGAVRFEEKSTGLRSILTISR